MCLPATHALATRTLRCSEALGEFGALKVEWACWGVGPARHGHEEELVLLGVPSSFSRDTIQERHFAWRVPDPAPSPEEEEEGAGEGERGPMRLEATPDILSGFKSA